MGDRDQARGTPAGAAATPLRALSVVRAREPTARPSSDADDPCELRLPALTSSARLARHWVMNTLAADGVFGADNQVIELLTGELVANAALHGPRGGLVRVRATHTGHAVRVEVRDDGLAEPMVQHPEPTALRGRGLALVEVLAADWGVVRHAHEGKRTGKTVWFSVQLDLASSQPRL